MGFNKRFLDRDMILKSLSKIDELLNVDALILDSWSSNFIKDLKSKKSLSQLLIYLSTEPEWHDIYSTIEILNINISDDISDKFDEQKKLCIESIIKHYDSMI